MLTILNRLIDKGLKKLGYQIMRINRYGTDYDFDHLYGKYKELIKETECLFREFQFKELPPHDMDRIILMSKLLGTEISEAIYILHYLHRSIRLEGDICEFGIAEGATSALMAYEIRKMNKNIWLFDSFSGLPKPLKKDVLKDDTLNLGSIEAYQGKMSVKIDRVKERLHSIEISSERVRVVPGFIEDTIKSANLPNKVCFAYVDFDFYEPILIALNFLNNVLQKNGFIIVDDYDSFSTGAKLAVDEFIRANQNKYRFFLPPQFAGHFCIIEKIDY